MVDWIDLPLELGKVTPMTAPEVAEWIARHRRDPSDAPKLLANLNLHALYMRESNPEYRRFLATATRVLIDGWPVLVLARRSGALDLNTRHRVGSTDWLDHLIAADPPLRITAIGGTALTAARAKQAVERRTTNLEWTAVDGFEGSDPSENPSLAAAVASADLVLVGMGMPLQERWIARHWDMLGGAIVANVGGCLDYYAGTQRLSPRWMGGFGLEWAYRLAHDPYRLAERYLVEPFRLVQAILRRRRGQRGRRELT